MKIKNKFKKRYMVVSQQPQKFPSGSLISFSNATSVYKKKNRKGLRINFRNFTLSGSLVGLNKI
jgi:hypothetical protein